ncbi:MAG: hypothetical protein KJ063_09755 [Anaerolineae bacterium]|nr:hypothetical protein [Anaerolineae bacterium]
MNPFTRFLSRNKSDGALAQLIAHCDALEALVIRVYKERTATAADEQEYADLRFWFQQNYHQWGEKLKPHWQGRLAGGVPVAEDPLLYLLAAATAHAFIGNWAAMQHLPAAREALNQWIVSSGQ